MRWSPLVLLHISAGITGLLAGTAAMSLRKGSPRHGMAGRVFAIAMLTMSGSGAYLALMKSQLGNVLGGVITFYLVATAWSAATRGDKHGETKLLDWAALLVAAVFEGVVLTFGFEALYSPTGLKEGYPPPLYFIWGFVVLLCIVGDVRMLARGGIFGTQRVARHLWRMSFALFIAAGSFFLGQQKVFPVALRGLKIWFVPPALALLLMIFWLIRVRITKAYQTPRQIPRHTTA
jgi:uncharacterized membrane protein